jgi:hypothetical protein
VQLADLDRFWCARACASTGANFAAINRYRIWLEENRWNATPHEAEYAAELAYVEYAFRAWDLLDDCTRPWQADEFKRRKLALLRDYLGFEAYEMGLMPPFPPGARAFIQDSDFERNNTEQLPMPRLK